MRVAVVTGSRADYGLLRPTIAALRKDPRFDVIVLATAMHLDAAFGATVAEIEADGHPLIRVEIPQVTPRVGDVARRTGAATIAFTEALRDGRTELLFVLGDRFEMLAAALAATSLELPIAHLHGGELSEGSLDDATRHCVTKLAHLHFVAARPYAERVCQLGEEAWRVHIVGAAALESIASLPMLGREELARALGLDDLTAPLLCLTLHATSLDPGAAEDQARAVTTAVDDVLADRGTIVVTLPNDDPGSHVVRQEMLRWAQHTESVHAFPSLGQLRYLSLLSCADAVLGNSSSALLEAPSFGLPVVNVGDRQRGRLMAANVISCPAGRQPIAQALRYALTAEFRASLADLRSPFGDGDVSRRILTALASAGRLPQLRDKRFIDLPDGPWRDTLAFGAT